jgi:hypothetical protein
MHILGGLFNKENELCAIFETILGHIDMNQRKTVNFSDTRLKSLLELKNNHAERLTVPFDIRLKIKDLV